VVENIGDIARFAQWPWHRYEGLDPGEMRTVAVHHFRPSNPMEASRRPGDNATQLHRENQTGGFAVNSCTAMILDTGLPTPYDFNYPAAPRPLREKQLAMVSRGTEDISVDMYYVVWLGSGSG